jgi:hypothetical protein
MRSDIRKSQVVTGTQLKGLAGALECTEVKDIKHYRRLSEDKEELVLALKEATGVINQEEPGRNRDPTKSPAGAL